MNNNVSDRITNILNYYKENKGCDPNVYEFIHLCGDYADYLNVAAPNYGIYATNGIPQEEARKKYPIPAAVSDKFQILWYNFKKKLLENDLGITEDSPLYELCQESARAAITYGKYGDEELRAKVGAVALYIAQEKRSVRRGEKPSFTYDNMEELHDMNQLDGEMKPNTIYPNKVTPRVSLLQEINSQFGIPFTKESTSNKAK